MTMKITTTKMMISMTATHQREDEGIAERDFLRKGSVTTPRALRSSYCLWQAIFPAIPQRRIFEGGWQPEDEVIFACEGSARNNHPHWFYFYPMNKKFGALAPTISDTYDTALYKFFICFNKFERHWKTLAKTMSLIISLSEPTVGRLHAHHNLL